MVGRDERDGGEVRKYKALNQEDWGTLYSRKKARLNYKENKGEGEPG